MSFVKAESSRLFFCCGLSRSGKSTYVKKWLRERDGDEVRQVVCADDIRLALGSVWCEHTEGYVKAIEHTMIKAYLSKPDTWVMVDETNTSEASMRKWFSLDPNATPVIFDTPLGICVERAAAHNQGYLVGPIKRMYNNLQRIYYKRCINYLEQSSKPTITRNSGYKHIESQIRACVEKVREMVTT